jgi:hypothetical protein
MNLLIQSKQNVCVQELIFPLHFMKSMQMVHSFSSGSAETAGTKGAAILAIGAAAGVAVLLTVFVIVFVDIFGKDQTKI